MARLLTDTNRSERFKTFAAGTFGDEHIDLAWVTDAAGPADRRPGERVRGACRMLPESRRGPRATTAPS